MNGGQLSESEEEKDLWVLVNKSLKPTSQCSEAARKQTLSLDLFLEHFITETDMFLSTCTKSIFALTWSSEPLPGRHGLKLI